MKKIIKKWGQGLGIYLDKEDQHIYKLQEGEIITLVITHVSRLKEKLDGPEKGPDAFKKKNGIK